MNKCRAEAGTNTSLIGKSVWASFGWHVVVILFSLVIDAVNVPLPYFYHYEWHVHLVVRKKKGRSHSNVSRLVDHCQVILFRCTPKALITTAFIGILCYINIVISLWLAGAINLLALLISSISHIWYLLFIFALQNFRCCLTGSLWFFLVRFVLNRSTEIYIIHAECLVCKFVRTQWSNNNGMYQLMDEFTYQGSEHE